MAGGIVLTSLGGVSGLISLVAINANGACNDMATFSGSAQDCDGMETTAIVSGIAFVVLVGVGIPMIVIGAERVPDESATPRVVLSPWASSRSGGLSLSGSF